MEGLGRGSTCAKRGSWLAGRCDQSGAGLSLRATPEDARFPIVSDHSSSSDSTRATTTTTTTTTATTKRTLRWSWNGTFVDFLSFWNGNRAPNWGGGNRRNRPTGLLVFDSVAVVVVWRFWNGFFLLLEHGNVQSRVRMWRRGRRAAKSTAVCSSPVNGRGRPIWLAMPPHSPCRSTGNEQKQKTIAPAPLLPRFLPSFTEFSTLVPFLPAFSAPVHR